MCRVNCFLIQCSLLYKHVQTVKGMIHIPTIVVQTAPHYCIVDTKWTCVPDNILVHTLKTIFPDFVHIFAHYDAQTTFFLGHICTYNEKLKHRIPGVQIVSINFLLIILSLGASITRSRCYSARSKQMQAYWRHGLRGTHERLQHIQVKSFSSLNRAQIASWWHGLRGTHERLQHIQVKSLV